VTSKAFKDINLSFKRHPVTNDLIVVKNEDAIKRSVKNIIFTILGEKPYDPFFGSVINDALFELSTSLNEIGIAEKIKSSLARYEPRIDDIVVNSTITPDSNEVNVTVSYEIVGFPSPSQRVDVILQPARV
tara:strand:- start:1520 stop:1912 length:393 start_codon:yes stop_codon:yes gene_type:complete